MKKSFPFALRLISLLTTLTFSFSGIGSAEMALSGKSAVAKISSSNRDLDVPAKLGRLESFHRGNTDKTIVHIQTAHGNYEAQKQIEAILKKLEETQGITTVLAEGSWQPLHPEFLRYFPENPKLANKINDALARKGLLQGSELYLIGSKNAKGYGIEDEQAYIENAEDFAAVVKSREDSRRFLDQMMDGIEKITSAYLSKDLRDFLRRVESFNNGKISLTDWIDELKLEVKNVYGEDLSDAGFQFEWPMLVRYFAIQKKEKEINVANFQSEKKIFLTELTRNDSRQALVVSLDSLLSLKSEHANPSKDELFSVISDLVQALPVNFNYDRFPTVKALIGILLLQTEIDAQALQNEIEKLTQLLSEKMAKSDVEKKMVSVYQRKMLLAKLLELELTSDDYAVVSGQGNGVARFKPSTLLNEIVGLNSESRVRGIRFDGVQNLDNVFEQAMRFYAGAKARDQKMIKNVEFVMDTLKLQKAVVITGGFHAGPFRDYFQTKGYSYGLVMPSISKVDESGREAYLKGMIEQSDFLAKKSTIEELLRTSFTGLRFVTTALRELGGRGNDAADHVDLALARSETRMNTRRFIQLALGAGFAASRTGNLLAQAAASSILVVDKKTGEQIQFKGVLKGSPEDKLFQLFVNGGAPGEAEKLRGDKSSEFYKKPISEIKISLARNAIVKILEDGGAVQYIKTLFEFAISNSRPSNISDEEFSLIRRMSAKAVVSILMRYDFPERVVGFFVSLLKKSKPVFLSNNIKRNILVDSLMYELYIQKSSGDGADLAVLAKKHEIEVSGLVLEHIETLLKWDQDGWGTDLKLWSIKMFSALLNAESVLDPFSAVLPPLGNYKPDEVAKLNESVRKSRLIMDEFVPTRITRKIIIDSFWGLLNNQDLFKSLNKQRGARKYSPLQEMLMAIALTGDPAELIKMQDYAGRANIPLELKVDAAQKITILKAEIGKKESMNKVSSARSEARQILLQAIPQATPKTLARSSRTFMLTSEELKLAGQLGVADLFDAKLPLEGEVTHKMETVPTTMQGWELTAKLLAMHPGLKLNIQTLAKNQTTAEKFARQIQQLPGQGFIIPRAQISVQVVASLSMPVAKSKVNQAVAAVDPLHLPKEVRPNLLRVQLDDDVAAGVFATFIAMAFPDGLALSYQNILKASKLSAHSLSFSDILAAVKAFTTSA